MRSALAFAGSVVALLCVIGSAAADTVYFGHADGFFEARDEFDLTAQFFLPGTGGLEFLNFGAAQGITALAASPDHVIMGTLQGAPHVRTHANLLNDVGPATNFTGNNNEPITDLALPPGGGVYLTTSFNCCGSPGSGGAIFGRTEASGLTAVIPGLSGDGSIPTGSGQALLAVASLSNGDAVIGSQAGELGVQSSTNFGSSVVTQQLGFGNPINDITIAPGDKIVVGTQFGEVTVRQAPDLTQEPFGGTALFGSPVRSLATLLNGNVAIGLQNGEVHVRDPNNILANLGNSGQFNNKPILALAVTSSGNLVIADGNGGGNSQVYIRDPNNVTALGVGVNGAGDGAVLISGADIQALAVIPEPATMALLGLGALVGLRRRR